MFKRNDPVSYRIIPIKLRQATVKEQAEGNEQWIPEKQPEQTVKGVVGVLTNFYLPVRLEDGTVVQKRPEEIEERGKGKSLKPGDVVSFISHQRNRVKMVNHKETIVKGKVVTVNGKVDTSLNELYIPVVVDGDTRHIPFKDLVFKEVK